MNRHNIAQFLILLTAFILFSCSAAQSQSKKNKDKDKEEYQEDLSRVRPDFRKADSAQASGKNMQVVAPSNDVTKMLNAKLDTLAKNNASAKYAQGYRVLVYSGRSSVDVRNARSKVYDILPDADIYQDFRSPNQRVKVGDCIDRIEAYSLFGKLKKYFPNAVIIPDQIVIKAK
jgi:hypothetical protein